MMHYVCVIHSTIFSIIKLEFIHKDFTPDEPSFVSNPRIECLYDDVMTIMSFFPLSRVDTGWATTDLKSCIELHCSKVMHF